MKKITNESVRRMIQTEETLATVLARRRLRYAGHVERGSSGKLAQLAVEGLIEGSNVWPPVCNHMLSFDIEVAENLHLIVFHHWVFTSVMLVAPACTL